jgi:D-alanine-D-alanine ligase
MSKIRVAILRGGPSHEHDASIESGANLLKQMRMGLNNGLNYNRGFSRGTGSRDEYVATDVFIDREGVWHIDGVPKKPVDVVNQFDVLWNALHGQYGEDGRVQNVLDQSMGKYTGSSAYTSAQVFNKKSFRNAISELSPEMSRAMLL